jgi:hypothetical protein
MKAHKKLMASLNHNPANDGKGKKWAKAHPVSAGIIPMVDYVPPSGSYTPSARPVADDARFVRQVAKVLIDCSLCHGQESELHSSDVKVAKH